MASIAVCPHCTSHLELPEEAYATAQLQCPLCDGEFELAAASARELPQALLLAPTVTTPEELAEIAAHEVPAAEAAVEVTPADRLSQLLHSTSQWRPSVNFPPAPAANDMSRETLQVESSVDDIAVPDAPASNASRLDQLLSDLMKSPPQLGTPLRTAAEVTEPIEIAANEPSTPPSVEDDKVIASFDSDEYEIANEVEEIQHEEEIEYEDATNFEPDEADEELEPAYLAAASLDHTESPIAFQPRNVLRRRPPSAIRSLVGIVGGGALGILLGGYGLLWLRGPEGDVMGLAQWLPASWLPPSARTLDDGSSAQLVAAPRDVEKLGDDAESVEQPETASDQMAADEEPRGWQAKDSAPEASARLDSAVTPATAVEAVKSASPPQESSTVASAPDATVEPNDAAAPTSPAEPASAPTVWPSTQIVADLRDVKLYSLSELDEALTAAESAQQRFLAGDLSRRESVAGMGQAYIELCALAERFTLVDPATYGNQLVTKQMTAKTVFRATVGEPARRNDLAIIAGRWLQHDRRQNQGAVLMGKVRDIHARGRWTEHILDVGAGEAGVQAAVLMEEIRFTIGAEAAVAGVIIAEPQKHIAGYDGDAAQVIVAGFNFAPEEFSVSDSGDLSDLMPVESGAAGQ